MPSKFPGPDHRVTGHEPRGPDERTAVKFDFEPEEFDELDEQAPNPRTLDAVARHEDDTAEFASPAFRMYRAVDHAQVRTRTDIARVRAAPNHILHTLVDV